MNIVKIEKNEKSVPSDQDIITAMEESNGTVIGIDGNNSSKTVKFTGIVNHTNFENDLIRVSHGKRTSWNFAWGN